MFAKIGVALTFSPTGKAILEETIRLQKLFESNLVLIHVGVQDSKNEKLLMDSLQSTGLNINQFEVLWEQGDPAETIIKMAQTAGIELLVAGALEKENIFKYYFGSVARKIMREFTGSSLILKSSSTRPTNFKKIYVSTDYSLQSEKTVRMAFQFALKVKAEEFVLIRDFHFPGLATTIQEGEAIDKIEAIRKRWQLEEEKKMDLFVKELNLQGLQTQTVCLYGREGWEAGNFAYKNRADLFVVSGPTQKIRFIDRIFPHEVEYSFEKLPSNLFIVK